MVRRQIAKLMLIGMVIVVGLFACVPAGTVLTPEPKAPTIEATTLPYPLATPYAQEPAAGICASFDGDVVTITINADLPDPRCAKVRPDQTLKVVNNTVSPLTMSIGPFKSALLAANSYSIAVPFSEYLLPGVHHLEVLPCCGAELWLVEK